MSRKLLLLMLLALLIGTLNLASRVEKAKASGTVYIRADGRIDPPDAPISTVDNVTYTLTGNITSDAIGIVVERSNIIIDGAGYTLHGSLVEKGFSLSGISNVTIRKTNIESFYSGVYLNSTSRTTISENNMTTNNFIGIYLSNSLNNNISGNSVTKNIDYYGSGIFLEYSSNNSVSNNHVAESGGYGIRLSYSSNNILRNNLMTNNRCNIEVYGYTFSHYLNDVDASNIIDGRRVYYLLNETDRTVPYDAGYVVLVNCTRITVQNLNLTKNGQGVLLVTTTNSTISMNNITANNFVGIWLDEYSNYNSIVGNNLTYNGYGIFLFESSNNRISENIIRANYYDGIQLWPSSDNTISGNEVTRNNNGIVLGYFSSNNRIFENDITENNNDGIGVGSSSNNTISRNNITANKWHGISLSESSNNILDRNSITNNSQDGTLLCLESSNNTLVGNNITNNLYGISLTESSNNSIHGNDIIANNQYGIQLSVSSENKIYQNDFINNTRQVYDWSWKYPVPPSINVWDDGYPSGGNYWSNYTGTDLYSGSYQNETSSDGIGDAPYSIDVNNTDNCPLMGMFQSYNVTYFTLPLVAHSCSVTVISNSTVSDFAAPIWIEHPEVIMIEFNVTEEQGTTGFCRVSFPTAMMNGTYHVFVNGTEVPHILLPCSNADYSHLYFTYTHSTEGVIIIPEFPSFLILPTFMVVTLLAVIFYRRKHAT